MAQPLVGDSTVTDRSEDVLDSVFGGELEEGGRAAVGGDGERLLLRHRRDMRIAGFIFAALGTWVVWGIGANVYMLANSVPEELWITVHSTPDLDGTRYRVEMEGLANAGSPVVLLGGREVPSTEGPDGPQVALTMGTPESIELLVDRSTNAGSHEGILLLRRMTAEASSAPEEIRLPVHVGVVSGPFSASWRVAWSHTLIGLGIGSLMYLVLVLLCPKPSGFLLVADSRTERGLTASRRIKLNVTPKGRIFPWARSTVSLEWAAKQAGLSKGRWHGSLEFVAFGSPPHLSVAPPNRVAYAPARKSDGLESKSGTRFREGALPFMSQDQVARIVSDSGRPMLTLRYLPRRF